MDDDQQFCLRWNNHQSTLISVFDTLLENGTLVDCTLAAEGKFLKAHKVVLSACSPYFATLLSQQYDKHPIFILKDVKFQELRAMMDYMYRGEVNISQDQLAALLKAAESLQIKGLSDNRSSASSGSSAHQQQQQTQQQKQSDASASAKTLQPPVPASKASGLTIENKRPLKSELLESDVSGSREGSTSPTRKRKKVRRRSVDTNNLLIDNHDQHSNSSSHSIHTASGAAGAATAGAAVGGATGAAAASAGASSLSSSSAAVGGGAAGGAAAAAGSNAGANVLSAAAVAAAAAIKKTETAQQAAAAAELMKLQLQKQQIAAAAAAAAAAASAQSSDDDERCGGPSSVATGTEHDDGNELTDNEHDGDGGSSVKSGARHHREGGGRRGNKTSTSTVGDLLIEPKSEYEDGQDENIEDLTMDDEELMDELDQAGPSHGGDVSSQGYAQWPLDREQNEAFIAAQDAVGGQHRDAQGAIADMLMSAYSHHQHQHSSTSLATEALLLTSSLSSTTSPPPSLPVVVGSQTFATSASLHQRQPLQPAAPGQKNSSSSSCWSMPPADTGGGSSKNANSSYCRLSAHQSHSACACPSTEEGEPAVSKRLVDNGRLDDVVVQDGGGRALRGLSGRIKVVTSGLLQADVSGATIGGASLTSTAALASSSKRFRCEYCSFSCSWRYDLKLHLKQKHGIHKKNV